MQIKFTSDEDQIDLNTVLKTLVNVASALEEINKAICPNRKLKVTLSNVEKGDYTIDIS